MYRELRQRKRMKEKEGEKGRKESELGLRLNFILDTANNSASF